MRKYVYTGAMFARGPYRGETPEAVADVLKSEIASVAKSGKIKVEEARQDFIDNIHPW